MDGSEGKLILQIEDILMYEITMCRHVTILLFASRLVAKGAPTFINLFKNKITLEVPHF